MIPLMEQYGIYPESEEAALVQDDAAPVGDEVAVDDEIVGKEATETAGTEDRTEPEEDRTEPDEDRTAPEGNSRAPEGSLVSRSRRGKASVRHRKSANGVVAADEETTSSAGHGREEDRSVESPVRRNSRYPERSVARDTEATSRESTARNLTPPVPPNQPRRTQKQPEAVDSQETGTQRRNPKRKSFKAPYVALAPILGDDSSSMEIDEIDQKSVMSRQASDEIKDPIICCIYCHDVGSYIWRCTEPSCRIPVCISKNQGETGCIDCSPDELTGQVNVTETTFICPQCHRAAGDEIKYNVQGYSVRQDYLYRNYFPLLAVFLSWSGFGSPYASNVIQFSLKEHFRVNPSRLRIATRALKSGNNRPSAMTPHFQWLGNINYEGNILIFVNTHSDTDTGNLVVAGNNADPKSLPIHELLDNYIGKENLWAATRAISAINSKPAAGPCVRGLVICSCGSTGRVTSSATLLRRMVEQDIFDFVLAFSGVSTMDAVIVPALNRFIENVYVYDMKIWHALEQSFGEDRHALNHSPVMLSFAEIEVGIGDERKRVVDTRVFALSNLRDGRPWGLDIFRCFNVDCQGPAYNMIFHPSGKQYYGKHWVETKIKYRCMKCDTVAKGIPCPSWIHASSSQNYGRVWYRWPLTPEQQRDIGIIV